MRDARRCPTLIDRVCVALSTRLPCVYRIDLSCPYGQCPRDAGAVPRRRSLSQMHSRDLATRTSGLLRARCDSMLSCFGLRRDVDARDSIAHDSSSPAAGSATLSERTDTTERLAALRDQLERRKLDAYVVLSEDAHGSEWVCSADKRRGA